MEPDNYSIDIEYLPIDKGYAWVICFGAGVVYIFTAGGIRVWGILILHWQEHYGLTATKAISITAVTNIIMSLLCPLVSAIGNAYSYRKVMFVSGFLMAVGIISTGFCTDELGLTMAFGVIVGIGFAGVLSSPIVIVGLYFDARRSLGNALFHLGASVGQFTLPAVLTYLFIEYDARGAIIIFGALFLNILPAALLCRPLSFFQQRMKKRKLDMPQSNKGSIKTVDSSGNKYTSPKLSRVSIRETPVDSASVRYDIRPPPRKSFFQKIGARPSGVGMSSTLINRHSVYSVFTHRSPSTATKTHSSEDERVIYKHCPFDHNEMHEVTVHKHHLTKHIAGPRTYSFSEPCRHSIRPSIHVQIKPFGIASYQNLSHHDAKKMGLLTPSHVHLIEESAMTRKGGNITVFNTIMTLFCSCCPVNEDPSVFPLYDWILLRNRLYVIFIFGSLLSSAGYFNVFVMLPAFCEENGLSEPDVAVMLAILAVGDLAGQILIGIVGDTDNMKRHNMLIIDIFIMGGVTVALPYVPISYHVLVVYCVIFGVLGGVFTCLLSVVCVDLLGIAELSGAYGLSYMFDGLFYFPVTILLGFAQDESGSNAIPLLICGSVLLAGGASFALLNYIDTNLYRDEHVYLRGKNES